LLPLVLSWCAFYEVERALQMGAVSEGAAGVPTTRWQYLMLHVRHYLGLLLVPVLGLLTVQDVAQWMVPDVLRGPYAVVVYLPPLAFVVAMFPTMLRRTWITSPLAAGPLRSRLDAAARRWGFRAREILVWHTGDMVVNAAVAGFVPRLRYVFLTDALLTQLTPEEIEAVFGHEVGHIRHRHLLARVLAMLVPVSLWLLFQSACPILADRLEGGVWNGGLGLRTPMGLMALSGLGLYVLVVFGAYSRILESQADLFGYRTASSGTDTPSVETFIGALEKLAAANGIDRKAASWQHGSVAQRVDLLRQAAADPRYERRYHRRVRLLNQAVLALVVSPLVYWLLIG
jgi:STE24 endopeptidase